MKDSGMRAIAFAAAILFGMLAAAPPPASAPPPADSSSADMAGCGVASGTLTMLATDNESDFAAFRLFDDKGNELGEQFIPTFSPDASAELMLTQQGFSTQVATAKCLADSTVARCGDKSWQKVAEGIDVSLMGFLLGPDWAVVSIKGRYVNPSIPAASPMDGSFAGFQLDKAPTAWSGFYDSADQASQAFFSMDHGEHTLTIGSRDPNTAAFVPQERLCFTT
jgi:hypothetical protein